MDRPKLPDYVSSGLPKLDNFTIISKRFTLSTLIYIGLTISCSCMTFSQMKRCLYSTIDSAPSNGNIDDVSIISYLLGYILVQIPIGWCSLKFSPLFLFGRTILLYSSLLFLWPLFIHGNYGFIILLKFFEGVFHGAIMVLLYAAWKNWTPSIERSTLIAFSISGGFFGDFVGELLRKFCSDLPRWEFIFCIHGTLGIIWWFVWESMVYDSPNKHRTISEKEHNYLHPMIQKELEISQDVSWKKIIFSLPFLALVIVNLFTSLNASFYMFPIEHMSFVHLMKVITFPLAGWLADVLLKKTSLSITHVRKLYITSVFILEVIYAAVSPYLNDNFTIFNYGCSFVIFILHLTATVAICVNVVDIAPNHAGFIMAFINIVSVTGYQIPFRIEIHLYNTNFYGVFKQVCVVAHLFAGIFYGFYGSGEPIEPK